MRGHIIDWLGVLSVAVIAVVAVGMWCFTSVSLPGEEVADSITSTLRGGDCYAAVGDSKCKFAPEDTFCDEAETKPCMVTDFLAFTGSGESGFKGDPNKTVCCGGSATACGLVDTAKVNCGTKN